MKRWHLLISLFLCLATQFSQANIHYAPYGELVANQQATGSTYDERYKFTGKERDKESGYDYFGARFLAHQLGIWTSPDPLLDKYLYVSPYMYCNGNPIKYVDPDGRWAHVALGALAGAALDYAFQVGTNMVNGDDFSTALTHDIDIKSIAVSAAVGAAGVGLVKSAKKVQQTAQVVCNMQKVAKHGQKAKGIGNYMSPNGGNAKPHGGAKHNGAIDKYIENLPAEASSVRKNQAQVDINDNKVGTNRPDVQYNLNGTHYNVEFDNDASRSMEHQKVIENNDPNSQTILILLD